ncbi:hypothetical protein NP233_g11998 [Leucocoprinus birnbaumii]|uniref:G domain-containing protein n=1 Tax=Leucocoprinus birnbaumii TaxID=56174 RepID=A0AAD5YJV1_9AGAR|nr:hypothetical protein NP233_g11998 [Leucocoprinus birnbaumii]
MRSWFQRKIKRRPEPQGLHANAPDPEEAEKLRSKYTHFRILVIGRANAGKTTMLKRVCNSTEDPCIYDEKRNQLLEPTSQRGIHDIRRPFSFQSNPHFIFHDSPGFEAGGEEELQNVLSFLEEKAKAKDVDEQLHAIWFCFTPDVSRPLLALEQEFFNTQRTGNVPVVAIFTKFDDLIIQVYDREKHYSDNFENALATLEEKFEKPIKAYRHPPRAYVRFQSLHDDEGNHQEQIMELTKRTAESIDDFTLKNLFVVVQNNNLEVCIECAVNTKLFKSNNDLVHFFLSFHSPIAQTRKEIIDNQHCIMVWAYLLDGVCDHSEDDYIKETDARKKKASLHL